MIPTGEKDTWKKNNEGSVQYSPVNSAIIFPFACKPSAKLNAGP
jgi:hypothetical protein